MVQKKIWKIVDIINTTTHYFKEKQIENPRLNAEMLLGKVLGLSRVDLYVSFDRPLSEQEVTRYRELVRRRAGHEPLQYILGETEFMGLPFHVSPQVLIPRPETEILVQSVLELKEEIREREPIIADIGTGSGCIAVSLARMWPEARFYATDVSAGALDLADQNAARNEVSERISFYRHDIFEPWPESLPREVTILVSNPPYIGKDELPALQSEVVQFEPREALTDEGSGLRFYERLLQMAFSDQPPVCQYLVMEMSGTQPQKIVTMAQAYRPHSVQVMNDLNQIPRVLIVKVNK